MKIEKELLPGAWLVKLIHHQDRRGSFVKKFTKTFFQAHGMEHEFAESFYTTSQKNAVRGMHFFAPPRDHVKTVLCAAGSVKDVLLDLRTGPGYGAVAEIILESAQPKLIYIPKGIAHGFLSLEDNSVIVYNTTTEYASECDMGVHWNSFGHDWNVNQEVIESSRDQSLIHFKDFKSPF
jgi:dTDP-4-dehydrorhamnose 3,5-epimerase/CDP-3, 6-dideoxy-D-glycero-D-glycero-4-hexulose-5-epimerase